MTATHVHAADSYPGQVCLGYIRRGPGGYMHDFGGFGISYASAN